MLYIFFSPDLFFIYKRKNRRFIITDNIIIIIIYYTFDITELLCFYIERVKGHDNEADFLGFFQKLVPHRSLTLAFEPFRFWLRIRRDIRNRKTTPGISDLTSQSRWLAESESRLFNVLKKTRRVGESFITGKHTYFFTSLFRESSIV